MDNGGQIDLARAAPFRLGPLTVEPALRQVTSVTSETLEPRVMQVLVALVRAEGGIVSRDDFVRQCWEGRIVGDDSVNRVISRLRRLAEESGGGSFRIETITKVGYRLVGSAAVLVEPNATTVAVAKTPLLLPEAQPTMRKRRKLQGMAGAVAVAAAAAFFVFRADLPASGEMHQAMVIDGLAVGRGLPPHVADDLREAIVAGFPPAAFDLRRGDGRRDANAFQLSGRTERQEGGVAAIVQLRVPGSDEPVWSARIERPTLKPVAIKTLGMQVAGTAQCVADGRGKRASERLSLAQLPLWVAFCDGSGDPMVGIDRARAAVAAAPHFDRAKLVLASELGDQGDGDPKKRAESRAEGEPLARAVLKTDPQNSGAWEALALLRPPLDFAGREALLLKAIAAHPTGCGCEHQVYLYLLSMVGRGREAEEQIRRTVTLLPNGMPGQGRLGETLAVNGRYGDAAKLLATVAEQWPDEGFIEAMRYKTATFAGDWPAARAMLATEPVNPSTPLRAEIVDARAAGNAARLRAAGEAMTLLLVDPKFLTRTNVSALALAGRDADAVAAAGRMIDKLPLNITVLYEPPFARARKLPAFAALVTRLGLVDYWRQSGHPPDFCLAADAPRLCAGLRRTT